MDKDYEHRLKKEAKIQQEPPTMESLPIEVALDILSRLPITTLINVKWVCRSWRSLTQHPLLPSMHFSRLAEKNDPCLLLLKDFPVQNLLYSLQFSNSDDTNIDMVTRIPVPMIPDQFHVMGSCNGLLYLQNSLHVDKSYICNPFTKDFIELPKPEQFPNQHRVALGFGFHSMIKEYKVVRIVYYRHSIDEQLNLPQSEVQVLTIRNNSLTWRTKGETAYQLIGKSSHVLANGRLHWLTCRYRNRSLRKLVSFDLEDEKFQEVPSPNGSSFGRHCSHLVTLRGCLSAVIHGFRSLYIWVMKEYGVEESWIKEFNIGIQLQRQLDPHLDQLFHLPHFPCSRSRVLCLLKNGHILIEHRCRTLVCCDPKSGAYKELTFQGLPELFNSFVHIGSLNWIEFPDDHL